MDSNAPNDHNDHNGGVNRRIFVDLTRVEDSPTQQVRYDESSLYGLTVYIGGHQGIWLPYNIEQTPAANSEITHPVDLDSLRQATEPLEGDIPQPHQPVAPHQVPQVPPPNRVPKRTREDLEEDQLEAQAPSSKRPPLRSLSSRPDGQWPGNPMPHFDQSFQGGNGDPQGHLLRPNVPGFWNPQAPMGNSYPMVNGMGCDTRSARPFPTNQPRPGASMPDAYTMPANGTPGFPVATQANHFPPVPANYVVSTAGPQGQFHGFHHLTQQMVPNGGQMRPLAPQMGPQMNGQAPYMNRGYMPPSNGVPQRMHPMVQMQGSHMHPVAQKPETPMPETQMSESQMEVPQTNEEHSPQANVGDTTTQIDDELHQKSTH
ncbi:hypothetical protein FVEN_g11694 [Fusarium venenatum]|uniref:Uncharacterized protein n=1 Tax=Fusarium venenatum TaxID=56646 RepID=A0A2L2TDR1_9HYPO|nr:uncharacterized protein FVRRES_11188 [Fusarium venenatum]KAG8350111.1 hypothetical protein FVEN_g11694 [Fusarium venenatum]KAH6977907.1 hypothetical protein EDB82DRAFT_203915 [Fusarium venenatum]CEI38497.1 unnamed protein product [Fusarium venenatum]